MAGGRKGKPEPPPAPTRTLVLDNGAFTIKAGFADNLEKQQAPRVIPNCLARDRLRHTYIGSELEQCQDFGELAFRRPVEKGYIVNWEAQRAIWDHEIFAAGRAASGSIPASASLHCNPAETRLVLTEQPNALPALQANCDQMVFEEFQFASYYRGTAAQFNTYLDLESAPSSPPTPSAPSSSPPPPPPVSSASTPAEIRLVIDSGYSFTTVTPILHGQPLHTAVRRLDVGGKLLTNYLTKLLSVRHYDMRHDTYIVNEIKEKSCYVALDFAADLDATWKGTRSSVLGADEDGSAKERRRRLEQFRTGSAGVAKEYVLPDYHSRMHGIVRDYDPAAAAARAKRGRGGAGSSSGAGLDGSVGSDEDVLTLRNERFVVTELLFHPSDIGLRQPGLPDVVAQSVACLPTALWPALLANIVVVGGNAQIPGFVQRLQREIQTRMPDDLMVRVTRPADPITCTWRSAARFATASDGAVERLAVTKQEYEEHGATWVARKFASGQGG